jgi:hypothetical protein
MSDAKQTETEVQETTDSTEAASTVTEQIGWHCLVKIVSGEHKGKQGRLRKSIHGDSLVNDTVYELVSLRRVYVGERRGIRMCWGWYLASG